ncbi:hypothetical protein [Streptomyces sp. SID13031]|uniref:hypothetical protein n=1 Tax=Streptomyces sp. SID13031 TaxID=2706046 RepID=UPI0013CBF6F0|nr:hypothetical protein [Streptomyces sp. SID13031]NEA34349.1 hypothetical protein [Streptomyces sp. SID13031]
MGWGKQKRAVLLAGLLLCAASLTACGPRVSSAVVGMTVDEAGNPVIVLQNCKGDITQLELFTDPVSPSTLVYENRHPFTAIDEIPLLTGTADWPPSKPVPKLRPTGIIVIKPWASGHSWSGRRTEFTLADLKTLKPGQVRHDWRAANEPPSYGASPGTSQYRITTLDDFTPDYCP